MASVLSGGCRYGEWWCRDVGDQDETGDPAHDQDDDGDWRDSDDEGAEISQYEQIRLDNIAEREAAMKEAEAKGFF